MVDFEGWHMPVQYGAILEEVEAVRNAAGLFDLGHMGRVMVRGPQAVEFVDRVATNHCARIPVGAIRYALLCREDGNPIDDVLLYRGEDGVFIVVNASNADRDLEWLRSHAAGFEIEIDEQTEELAMLALQGPRSQDVLQSLTEDCNLADIGYYRFGYGTVAGMQNIRISRTGYTGEDGFEIYFPQDQSERVWNALLEAGKPHGLLPIGLGARDTLRLEAGMPLYGHEIDEQHNPIEAGLGFGVSFREEKGEWIGREALAAVKAAPTKRLMGITTSGPRVPRQGMAIYRGEEEVGHVCSGSVSPTIDSKIGSAYLKLGSDTPGLELELDMRGKRQACVVQELPFYSRTRK